MEDSRRLAEAIVIRLNRHGAGLSNLAIGHVMEVLEMNGIGKVKNLVQPDVSGSLPLTNKEIQAEADKQEFIMADDDAFVMGAKWARDFKRQ